MRSNETIYKKRVAPMWFVPKQAIYEDALFHYGDKERAERQGNGVKLVYVVMSSTYFIGTWQFANLFEGFIFDSEEEAIQSVVKGGGVI